jgi:murein DD-endopeptidase MepM/ murein hydrolase activator NlpD
MLILLSGCETFVLPDKVFSPKEYQYAPIQFHYEAAPSGAKADLVVALLAPTYGLADKGADSLSPIANDRVMKGEAFINKGITQGYDVYYEKCPTGKTSYGGWHAGIDFRAQTPLPVFSPVKGIVASLDEEGTGCGRVSIRIDGSNGYFIFLHLSRVDVKKGSAVNVGLQIGRQGTSAGTIPTELNRSTKGSQS